MLEADPELNQHRDYHNHPDLPSHTLNFGKFSGGRLEMLHEGAWNSYARMMVWLSFDAQRVAHRVTPITEGVRYSVTVYTPEKLERLTSEDWDCLGKLGIPIYLYNPESFQIRRLEPGDQASQDNCYVQLRTQARALSISCRYPQLLPR